MNTEQLMAERDRYRTALQIIAGEESGVWGVIAAEALRADSGDVLSVSAQHPEPGSLPKLPQAAFNLEKGSGR